MKKQLDSDPQGKALRSSVCTFIATLCVLGLVGLSFFHANGSDAVLDPLATVTLPDTGVPLANSDFLRAPTTDPSLPSLEATFSRKDVTPADVAPAPTF